MLHMLVSNWWFKKSSPATSQTTGTTGVHHSAGVHNRVSEVISATSKLKHPLSQQCISNQQLGCGQADGHPKARHTPPLPPAVNNRNALRTEGFQRPPDVEMHIMEK